MARSERVATANATFCAALVDQWIAEGLTAAFIAPGSRSTPLAVALAERSELRTEVFHDERAASFAALGHGLATERPAIAVCTSGTAATHFFAPVVEAQLSAVPMLVATADRPPELQNRGAPQTIDQNYLYGPHAREHFAPGPPDDLDPATWRHIARRSWQAATGTTPGPVHLNLAFREPLLGSAHALPAPLAPRSEVDAEPSHGSAAAELAVRMAGRTGVIVAGRNQTPPDLVVELAERLGWPILADHRSGCRIEHRLVIHRFDSLLRHPGFADRNRPAMVLRVGEIVSSKAVSAWLRACAERGTTTVASQPHGRRIDPEAIVGTALDEAGMVVSMLAGLGDAKAAPADSAWADEWRRCDDLAEQAVAGVLEGRGETDSPSEIDIARRVLTDAPSGSAVMAASSMPVRDLEWFGPPRHNVRVLANRGANGIDGTISTAIGVAASGMPTTVLVGDVALLHDSTALVGLARRAIDLTIVVIDNDGGGIFSFLPQHDRLGPSRYEQLFGTPHGTDLAGLAASHGLAVAALTDQVDVSPDSVRVLIASTDRDDNRRLHDQIHAAVAQALDQPS